MFKQTKKDKMYQKIQEHGDNLIALGVPARGTSIDLCRQLRRLEFKANKIAIDYCNGVIEHDKYEVLAHNLMKKVRDIVGNDLPIFFNGDPRGYTLKIDDGFCKDKRIYRDWGGYGILAPDFGEAIA